VLAKTVDIPLTSSVSLSQVSLSYRSHSVVLLPVLMGMCCVTHRGYERIASCGSSGTERGEDEEGGVSVERAG